MNRIVKSIKHRIGILIVSSTYFLYFHSKKNGLYSFLYFIQKCFLSLISLTPFNLTNHLRYAESYKSSFVNSLIKNRVGYTSNLIFGIELKENSLIPVELPDICLAKHNNVRIKGNSDFIINVADNLAINDFGFNMSDRYENIDSVLYRQKGNMSLLKYDGKQCDSVKEFGIMLTGNYCQNYYHMMYEIMVKLMFINDANIPIEVPLIVDEIVFKTESFKQLFETLNRTDRKVETIAEKEMVEFGILFCISAVNRIPPNLKDIYNILATDIVFDIILMRRMRECLLAVKSNRHFPKKIFISRKNSNNRKYNEAEVVDLVKKYGFSVVLPEEYNFFEQITLFNEADNIIGASGAAFANILFCHNNCHIICMQPRKLNIPAFTTIAYSLGINMRYCLGKSDTSDLHSSFQIDLEMLELMISDLTKDN